jgi:hypothetical protein
MQNLEELRIDELRSEAARLKPLAFPTRGGVNGEHVNALSKVREQIERLEARAEREATLRKVNEEAAKHASEQAALNEIKNSNPAYRRF